MSIKYFYKLLLSLVLISIIFLAYTHKTFQIYESRALKGNINYSILSAERFGTPDHLKNRGIEPLYKELYHTGWDGQFYYYIANDLLANKGTDKHLDAPIYRYQRIGLPLYSAIIAKLTNRDFVSPKLYFYSYFLLTYIGTILGAIFLFQNRIRPEIVLLWSLSVGTQITLFNGLPDAAADAFLIIALLMIYFRNYFLSILPFTFAILSREIYLIFPIILLLTSYLKLYASSYVGEKGFFGTLETIIAEKNNIYFKWNRSSWLIIPIAIFFLWQTYIFVKFSGTSTFEFSKNYPILGIPFYSLLSFLWGGVTNTHAFVGVGINGLSEAISIAIFLSILLIAGVLSVRYIIKNSFRAGTLYLSIAICILILIVVYVSFGSLVAKHYSGYLKSLSIFFFLVPILIHLNNLRFFSKIFLYTLLLSSLIFTNYYNLRVKILPGSQNYSQYTNMGSVLTMEPIQCFEEYKADMVIKKISRLPISSFTSMFQPQDIFVINLDIKNTSENIFYSYHGVGGVFISYNWLDRNGAVIVDGIRTALPKELNPNEVANLSIVTKVPVKKGRLDLIISPVQEGCAWFYNADPLFSNPLN